MIRWTVALSFPLLAALLGCPAGDARSTGTGGGGTSDDTENATTTTVTGGTDTGGVTGDDTPGCPPGVCQDDATGKPCAACDSLPTPYGTSCKISGTPDPPTSMTTENAFPNLLFNRPVHLTNAGDGTGRLFVVGKLGSIVVLPNDPSVTSGQVKVFLDIKSRVDAGPNEAGLLSVAFHPDYKNNGRLFVNYTGNNNGQLSTFISRFDVTSDPDKADASSEQVLMVFPQPFGNHNGGQIAFGPDGYLYIGTGDGGSGGDPYNYSQNLQSLLGKMLRIDVDKTGGGLPYAIPADNPFATSSTNRKELYAWGLRNPWRFSFDSLSGKLWAGDVGQDLWEFVHIVEKGKNYGWRIVEGTHCFNPKTGCDKTGLETPVVEYSHSQGESITGGHVYRGKKYPALYGAYVYGDYASRKIWAARFGDDDKTADVTKLADSNITVSSFGEDEDRELYVVDYPYFQQTKGKIFKLVPQAAAPPTSNFPLKLSDTGCFTDVAKMTPAPGLIGYTVNASLWHDGARSERYVVLPDGGKMTPTDSGAWSFPEGTRFIKTFIYDQAGGVPLRTETRFIIREGARVKGYTYKWNAEQTDAELLSSAAEETYEINGTPLTWHFPSRSQCLKCHNEAAGETLGLQTGQLNRSFDYGGVTANQLYAYERMGVLSSVPANPVAFPDPADTSAPLEKRARAALHVNCGNCHLPDGPITTPLDLRYETALSAMNACEVAPEKGDLGVTGAKIIAAGKPESSVAWLRMKALNDDRMPSIGSFVVDTPTVKLINEWITGLSGCE